MSTTVARTAGRPFLAHRVKSNLDWKFTAIFASAAKIAPKTHQSYFGLFLIRCTHLLMFGDVPFRHQRLYVLSHQFLSTVAKQLLRARIDQLDCSVLIHQHETVGRGLKKKADISLLNDQTLNQRTDNDGNSHINAADEGKQQKFPKFTLAGVNKKVRDNEVPCCNSRQESCEDAGPEPANKRSDDDRRIKSREHLYASVAPNDPAHQDGKRDHEQRQAVGGKWILPHTQEAFYPRVDLKAECEWHRRFPQAPDHGPTRRS